MDINSKLTVAKYNKYVEIMQLVKKRVKQEKEFIKIVSRMIQTKKLSTSDENRLNELLGIKEDKTKQG